MQSIIIAFFVGGAFIGTISFFIGRMLHKSDVVGMCEKNCKRVCELEKDNRTLNNKFNYVIEDNRQILEGRNKFAEDISNKLT